MNLQIVFLSHILVSHVDGTTQRRELGSFERMDSLRNTHSHAASLVRSSCLLGMQRAMLDAVLCVCSLHSPQLLIHC